MWDIGHCDKETAGAVSAMPAQQSGIPANGPRGAGEDGPKWRLADWSTAATVRSVARRRLADKDRGLPFSPELVPLMSHELVRSRDDAVQKMILGQKLHSYFRFTTHLELKAVLPACTMIGLKESVVLTSDEFAHDGFKIAVDEAHHAYCAEDMKQQLTAITAVRPYRERWRSTGAPWCRTASPTTLASSCGGSPRAPRRARACAICSTPSPTPAAGRRWRLRSLKHRRERGQSVGKYWRARRDSNS
jgi:hypothetical protein